MEILTIGQLAKEANINLESIRFYERMGLLPKPRRNSSGYRQYSQEDLKRIRFIKQAQTLGFSLNEVSKLLSLRVNRNSSCQHVKQQTEDKIEEIEMKILDLNKIKKALKQLASECKGAGPTDDCPILRKLDFTKPFISINR